MAAAPPRRTPPLALSTRTNWAEYSTMRCSVLNGKPVPIKARPVPSTPDTSIGSPFFQAPLPRAAHQRSPVCAHETAPTAGIPSIANATEEACIGWPCRKFVVPSRGSMIQAGPDGGVASGSPEWLSSATIAWSGWFSRMTATQASCAARSVADTKSARPFAEEPQKLFRVGDSHRGGLVLVDGRSCVGGSASRF